jgi:hypothetical protein
MNAEGYSFAYFRRILDISYNSMNKKGEMARRFFDETPFF